MVNENEKGAKEGKMTLYLPQELKDRLFEYCKKEGLSVQAFVRSLIIKHLNDYEKKEKQEV